MLTVETLSAEQMLERWKLVRLVEPVRTDALIVRQSGVDLDSLLLARIREWYVDILTTAPLAELPLTDISDQVTMTLTPSGGGLVNLPDNCLRVAEVMVEGWHQPAKIINDPADPEALAQANPYARAGSAVPVAVRSGDRLTLYTPPRADSRLLSLRCVMLPDPDTYLLTEAMKL